jgi:hypothetical protein
MKMMSIIIIISFLILFVHADQYYVLCQLSQTDNGLFGFPTGTIMATPLLLFNNVTGTNSYDIFGINSTNLLYGMSTDPSISYCVMNHHNASNYDSYTLCKYLQNPLCIYQTSQTASVSICSSSDFTSAQLNITDCADIIASYAATQTPYSTTDNTSSNLSPTIIGVIVAISVVGAAGLALAIFCIRKTWFAVKRVAEQPQPNTA